jgi:Protein of unknown function DUF262
MPDPTDVLPPGSVSSRRGPSSERPVLSEHAGCRVAALGQHVGSGSATSPRQIVPPVEACRRSYSVNPVEPRRTTTVWSVADVRSLHETGELDLAPEFQRNSVWPRRAKGYFVDSLLLDRPVPIFIVDLKMSAQTGRTRRSVIDGQQRLRAILEFLDDRYRVIEASDSRWAGRRFSELEYEDQSRLLSYPLLVQVLEGYDEAEIRDIFVRLNRYVARLAPQELRHARSPGVFASFAEELGALPYWRENRIFSANQIARMRPVEFSAELVILVVEGPQDKKVAVDLYYDYFVDEFPDVDSARERVVTYMDWIAHAVDLPNSRFRRPVDFYGLVGALERINSDEGPSTLPEPQRAQALLSDFDDLTRADEPPRDVGRYLIAASRQTDNLAPRVTRIEVLERILRQA